MDLQHTVIPDHARLQIAWRQIREEEIRKTLHNPEAVLPVRQGRVVVQGPITVGDPPKVYLLRIFVDVDRNPPELVTAYRTSKIDKYRSPR